jgi:ATP-dependent Clp protease ATP-binding subunit ClpA
MFERFSEEAVEVIVYSQEESRRLGHNNISAELLLLGLIRQEKGLAAKVLKSMGVKLKDARREVEKIIGRGSGCVSLEIPFTPIAQQVLELSAKESRQQGHYYVGTEHLLLAFTEQTEEKSRRILENLRLDPQKLRTQVIRELSTQINGKSEKNLRVVVTSVWIEHQIKQLSAMLTTAQSMLSGIEKELQVRVVCLDDVANAIARLPNTPKPEQRGIKELLKSLHTAIEADSNLNPEDKTEALEQVLVLAEAGQNATDERMRKSVKRAIKILRGTVAELPDTSKLVKECDQLLSVIAKQFS